MKKYKKYLGYPALFHNKRVVILDSSEDKEFGMGHKLVLYDKLLGLEFAWADELNDGTYKGWTHYGPHEITIVGNSLSNLASNALHEHKWILEN